MEAAKQNLLPSYLTQYEQGQTKLDKEKEQFVVIKTRAGDARITRINNRDDVKEGLTNVKLLKYKMLDNQSITMEETGLNIAIGNDQIQSLFAADQSIDDIQNLMSQKDMKDYLKSINTNSKKIDNTTEKTGEDLKKLLDITNPEQILETAKKLGKIEKAEYKGLIIEHNKITIIKEDHKIVYELEDGKRKESILPNDETKGTKIRYDIHQDDMLDELSQWLENKEDDDDKPEKEKEDDEEDNDERIDKHIFQNIEKSKGERNAYHETINNLKGKDSQEFMRKLLKYLVLKDKDTGAYRKNMFTNLLGQQGLEINGYTIKTQDGKIIISHDGKSFQILEDEATNKFFNIKHNSLAKDGEIKIHGETLTQDNGKPYEPASQIDGRMMLRLLHAIVGTKEKPKPPKPPKPEIDEPEIDEPEIDDADIKAQASITTIGQLSKDEALKVAEQEYQDMYNELRETREETKSGNSNFENAKRLTRFSFNAKRIRQGMNKAKFVRNRVTELIQTDANANDLFVEKGVAAANFHEIQNKHKINTTTQEATFNNPEINEAVSKYINGDFDKTAFEAKINKLINTFKNSNDPAHAQIKQYFTEIEIDSSHKRNSGLSIAASNISEKAEALKAEGELAENIVNLYEQNLNFEEFKAQAKLMASEYINNYQKIPEIKALIDETAEDPEEQEQLMLKIRQKAFIFKKKLERGKIQIDLALLRSNNDSLTKAYNVDENKLQNGVLEKWAHRVKNAHPAWRRTARIGLAASYVAGSVFTMGLANTAIAGGAVAARKRRDYSDQYKNMQERMAQDYDATAERIQEQETIANDNGDNYNKIQRHTAQRQVDLYRDTIQENFKFTEDVIDELSVAMIGEDKDKLLAITTDAMARLRMAQKDDGNRTSTKRIAGINFLRSREQENAGQEYAQLHKLLDLAMQTLNLEYTDIYTSDEYKTIETSLQDEAKEKLDLYRKKKRNLGIKYGLVTGAIHGSLSAAVQFDILGYMGIGDRDPTGAFGSMKEDAVTEVITGYTDPTIINTPPSYGFDSTIDADMHRIYGADYDNIKASLDQLRNSGLEYNWTEHDMLTLKQQLAESFKEGIVFNPVDASGQMEIVRLATDSGNLIANLDKGFVMSDDIFQKTLQARYGNISPDYASFLSDQTQLTEVMKGIVDGSVDPMTLPEHQRRIAAEAFHQFFHDPKDITQLYFDTTPGSTLTIPGNPIYGEEIIERQRKSARDRIGFPTFWQTVMRRGKKDNGPHGIGGPGTPETPITPTPLLPGTIAGPGGRTIITDKPKFYEKPKTIVDKPIAKPGYTIGVSTRGQEVGNDRENIKDTFPEKWEEKSPKELADIIVEENFPISNDLLTYDQIIKALSAGDKKTSKKLLEIEIKNGRESNNRFLKETELIEKSLDAVETAFKKLGLSKRELSFLPKKEQIHLVPELEFWGTEGSIERGLMGVRYTMSGEIIVNCSAMGDRENNPSLTQANLTNTIIHEIIHDTGVNNYWKIQERNEAKDGPKEGGKLRYEPRRVGIMMFRREEDEHRNVKLRKSGRARNEALTNRATDEAIKQLYPKGLPEGTYKSYRGEEEVLQLIEKQFNITKLEMVQPLINRKATDATGKIPEAVDTTKNPLRVIKEKIEGREDVDGKLIIKRPHLMDLIMGVMDYEEDSDKRNYTKTKELINLVTGDLTEKTKPLTISKEMQKYFRKGVFDNKGKHALEIEKAYSFIKIEGTPQAQGA